MGVTILHQYQIPEGMSSVNALERLGKRILALGAKQSGQFLVDCETYIFSPPHGTPKIVHVLHNSEFPASTFSILDAGNGKIIPVVADNLFDLLMLKISVYTSKKQTKIESKGTRFEYGDFLIKIGAVTMLENFKGILIELEYLPCSVLSFCWEMLRELLMGFTGQTIPKEFPTYFTPAQSISKQNDVYEAIDTINQYLDHFSHYRKLGMHPPGGTPTGSMSMGMRSN